MPGPLDRVRVVDLTRALAGPYCTLILGDMGAEVIKVELPGSGDETRVWGPPFLEGESSYFMSINRNKKSLTLDLKRPAGREVLGRLVAPADVLVENFRPGAMARLGLSYEQAARLNPRLVYCSISGFGQTGPRAGQPAYDQILQGMGGAMSLTGPADGPPTKFGIPIGDIAAGMFGAYAIACALFARERGGRGQWIDTSMLGSQVALLTFQAGRYFATGTAPGPGGNRHPSIGPYETFAARDGYVNVACGNERMWQRFCKALGLSELLGDPRFSSNADRVANREPLSDRIQERLADMRAAEVIRTLEAAEVPCGPVYSLAEVFDDAQTEHLELRRRLSHPRAGEISVTGFPWRLSETPAEVRLPPPLLGEHTDEVLQELGYSGAQIEGLRDEGVV
ncbi:MAG TPA: CoA transferase [Chloroflexota bacterium]|nr:CoA transferase [Chloroflexota bacterium]